MLLDLLDHSEIQALSEKNESFSRLSVEKDILMRDIRELLTEIVRNDWTPLLVQAPMGLGFVENTAPKYWPLYSILMGVGVKLVKDYDFREKAPPIQKPLMYRIPMQNGVWTYTWFNYEFSFYHERPKMT